jgi:excisionase family DNA binding protein
MAASELQQQTYLPDEAEPESLDELLRFVTSRRPTSTRRYLLLEQGGKRVELPAEVYRVVRQVAEAMSKGLAVSVVPLSMKLTTQQAADLLGISRPTLLRLLEREALPYERVGTHRRLLLKDVLRFREARREEQYRALEETALPLDDEPDVAAMLEATSKARKRVAERRRAVKQHT